MMQVNATILSILGYLLVADKFLIVIIKKVFENFPKNMAIKHKQSNFDIWSVRPSIAEPW